MKTINNLILLLALVIQMQACKKDTPIGSDETTNWGYVKEFYTQKPIPNAMVVVYGKNPMWAVQDTLYTDSNGRYEFGYVKYLPELQASALGYFNSGLQPYAPGDFFDKFNRTIYLYQPAEMILHVKNVNPFDGNIQIDLNDFIPVSRFDGKGADTMVCCLLGRRYTEIDFQIVVRKNGIDSLFLVYHTPTKATGNVVEINY
jgi:hypothetical protein